MSEEGEDSKKRKTSRYRGVCWLPRRRAWRARIERAGKRVHIGYYPTEEEAARAYDKHSLQLSGPSGHLNFPNEPSNALPEQGLGLAEALHVKQVQSPPGSQAQFFLVSVPEPMMMEQQQQQQQQKEDCWEKERPVKRPRAPSLKKYRSNSSSTSSSGPSVATMSATSLSSGPLLSPSNLAGSGISGLFSSTSLSSSGLGSPTFCASMGVIPERSELLTPSGATILRANDLFSPLFSPTGGNSPIMAQPKLSLPALVPQARCQSMFSIPSPPRAAIALPPPTPQTAKVVMGSVLEELRVPSNTLFQSLLNKYNSGLQPQEQQEQQQKQQQQHQLHQSPGRR